MSEIITKGSIVRIKPRKDVIASMAEEFKQELLSMINDTYNEIIIDLEGVEMIDSIGIGVICATHNSINKTGGTIKVTNVSNDIYKAFKAMRLHHHFTIDKTPQ